MSTIRFGQSAKKIKNQLIANVSLSSNVEGMKRLIAEYRHKLDQFENDQDQREKLMKVIEELEQQKQMLKDRLKN